jgi:hypothetical protein
MFVKLGQLASVLRCLPLFGPAVESKQSFRDSYLNISPRHGPQGIERRKIESWRQKKIISGEKIILGF